MSNVASTKWNVASTLLLVWTGLYTRKRSGCGCLLAQLYDGGERGSDVIAGRALVVSLVDRRRSQDTQSAVCDEQVPVRKRRHVQSISVFPPLIPVRNVTLPGYTCNSTCY